VSLLIPCPHCGPRDVAEFRTAGEVIVRPVEPESFREVAAYLYLRRNAAGPQREWWYHRLGCQTWFLATRDTRTNVVLEVGAPAAAPVVSLPPPDEGAGMDRFEAVEP
jgi:heterotetrameric sarcosine oxidase delta subunit